eukprot:scaffold60182_cov55-Phaeocystis_antarctica.AAC.1
MPASGGGGEGGVISNALHLGIAGAGFGALGGCVQSAWTSAPPSQVMTVFGRNVASHAGMLGAVAAVFGATEALATQTRGPSMLNSMVAGPHPQPQPSPHPLLLPRPNPAQLHGGRLALTLTFTLTLALCFSPP